MFKYEFYIYFCYFIFNILRFLFFVIFVKTELIENRIEFEIAVCLEHPCFIGV